jgi:uncharacterized protein (DUF952 family)
VSDRVFHITSSDAWEQQKFTGRYRHESLDREGFIHCSDEGQVEATWRRVFGGEPGLVLLEIHVAKLESELRYEEGEPGEMFPHVYGPVNVDAVTSVTVLP